jgi:site-specific DNA-cytosine methylase
MGVRIDLPTYDAIAALLTRDGPRLTRISEQTGVSRETRGYRSRNGVPAYVDRMRCLGNAIVPQVAQWIGERILEAERLTA